MDKTTRTALSNMAAGQRGLFSVAQAKEIGVTSAQLSRGNAAGQFRRVRRGVYAVNGACGPLWERVVGAALAAGPEAVVSHSSAAAVHRFEYGSVGAVELTLPRWGYSRPEGAVVHRSRDLTAADVVTRRGLSVTSACRTLVDLAGRLSPALLEKLLDEGLIDRRWALGEVQQCLSRARPNLPGRSQLQRLLRLRAHDSSADSALEARTFRALRPLKPFEVHFAVEIGAAIYVMDVAWPERKVGAEVIGWAHRSASRSAFDRERRKLNALVAADWKVAHLTAAMSAAEIVSSVRALLADPRRVDLVPENVNNSTKRRGGVNKSARPTNRSGGQRGFSRDSDEPG